MTHDWITTLLALGFFAATAAFFIVWSKYEDQKQKTAEEHNAYRNALEYGNALAEALREEQERRWDEISRALSIEKEKNKEIETLNEWNGSFEKRGDFWYDTSEKLVHERDALQDRLSDLQTKLEREKAYFESCRAGNHALQDRLSALLCPRNDHVWKDGVCVKCGRVK